jgi:hypothetical protein
VSNLQPLRELRADVLKLIGAEIEALTVNDIVKQAELQGYVRELCLTYETELSLIGSGKLPDSITG